MWNSTRRGRTITRRRKGAGRSNINFKLVLLVSLVLVVLIGVSSGIVAIFNMVEVNKAKNEYTPDGEIIESDASVDVFEEENEDYEPVKELKITALGEIMMGGKVGQNVEYNYMSAFRHISEYTKGSDYTMAHLATNIVDLQELGDTNSRYIVTTKIDNAFNALGIDGLNIATDHILDFGKTMLNDTINFLQEDYDLIGLNNSIIYVEKDGIKVAIIGVCNETIGSEATYTSAGIMVYNLNKVKALIATAKESASAVIVMTHLGNENSHTITNGMKNTYKAIIKAGADVVLGSHSLGVYPIEMYKGKPIIYSLGYLMHDTSYENGKKGGIFNLTFNEQGNLKEIEIIPTYINAKKQTILMNDYNATSTTTFLKTLAGEQKDYRIIDNKLVVNIDK